MSETELDLVKKGHRLRHDFIDPQLINDPDLFIAPKLGGKQNSGGFLVTP